MFVSYFFTGLSFVVVVLDRFHLGVKQMWSLVALNRWLSYAVTMVQEFAWVDPTLVLLDEWSSYRCGRLNRFDCIILKRQTGFLKIL